MRRPALLAGLALLALPACGALDEFEEVLVDELTIPAARPAGAPFSPAGGGAFGSVDLAASRGFSGAGVGPEDVDAILVRSVRIEADSGSGNAELDRLDRLLRAVTLFVEAPGLARTVVASGVSFPAGAATDLEVPAGLDLKPFAVAPSMSIGAEVTLERAPPVNVKLRTTVTLLVDLDLLGS